MKNGIARLSFVFPIVAAICFQPSPASGDGDEPRAEGVVLGPGVQSEVGPPEPGAALLAQVQDACAKIIERVSPVVTAVRATRRPMSSGQDGAPLFAESFISTGSGIILSPDGFILTCEHVIREAMAIDVVLADGRSFRAQRVAEDARADMAVLRIRARNLPHAAMGDGDAIRPGHLVLALGGRSGWMEEGHTAVGMGLVGAVGRMLPRGLGADADRYYAEMIQFSAPVGPGNSGGPLVDIGGRVIGIVTANAPAGAMGFALPLNRVNRRLIERLSAGETIEYGYLGAEVAPIGAGATNWQEAGAAGRTHSGSAEADYVAHFATYGKSDARPRTADDGSITIGAAIVSIERDGPADLAGLDEGDVVTSVDDRVVGSPQDFVQIVGGLEVGAQVPIAFRRNGREDRTIVRIARRPAPTAAPPELPREVTFRGARLAGLSQEQRETANLPQHAMLVTSVIAGSPADAAGLNPGDVVVRCEGSDLSAAATERLREENDHDVLLGLANGGSVLIKAP